MMELVDGIDELAASLTHLTTRASGDLHGEIAQLHALRERLQVRRNFAPSTVVAAIAGTTGAGKSSLFNWFTGGDAAEVGAKRPTTTSPMAAIFGTPEADVNSLLDWLHVPTERRISATRPGLESLVLIDLPDIDSISEGNREVAHRFIESVDVIIWVVDPEKYADSRIHNDYLRPYARHAPVMEVLLNQADRLSDTELRAATADFQQLLRTAQIDVVVSAVSARSGVGLPELVDRFRQRIESQQSLYQRAGADAQKLALELAQAHPFDVPQQQLHQAQERFERGIYRQIQAPQYVRAAGLRHGKLLQIRHGWPPLRILHKGRKIPRLPFLATDLLGLPMTELRATFAGPGVWNQALRTEVDRGGERLVSQLGTYRANPPGPSESRWLNFVGGLQWLGLVVFALAALVFGVERFARYFGFSLPPALQGVEASAGYPALPDLRWSYLLGFIGLVVSIVTAGVNVISIRVATRRYRRRVKNQLMKETADIIAEVMIAPLLQITAAGYRYQDALTKITVKGSEEGMRMRRGK